MPAPRALVTLSEAIDEYLLYRSKKAHNTYLTNKRSLSMFLAQTGNIQMRHLDVEHGQRYGFYLTGKYTNKHTINSHRDSLSGFVKWAHVRGHLPKGNNPMALIERSTGGDRRRHIVHVTDFGRLLDAAHSIDPATGEEVGSAHDRIVVALGLYLFLRQSEIKPLTIGDVNLDRGEITVTIYKDKAKTVYVMGISQRLDRELRRWFAWYAADTEQTFGTLPKTWYLVPRRKAPKLASHYGHRGGQVVPRATGNCLPTLMNTGPHRNVQRALLGIGVPLRDADTGKSNGEGVHTLRRSGARALFDRLCDQSKDRALKQVSAMLHHKSVITTERYLQINIDQDALNDLIRGEDMFGEDELDKVTPIRKTN